uniref:Adhesion regulating molecule 1 n=1 Tax=Cyprinus carpio TaxID=7962 RepID=A0A8C1NDV0_CYPCA
NQCTTGHVFVLKFKAGSKRLFFWLQESKTDKDEEYCQGKVNEYLNNPPIPGTLGSGGGSSSHELSALGGEGGLQSLLGNMSHNQLMQLIGPTGLGGLGGLGALAGPGLASLLGSGVPATSSSSSSSHSQSTAVTSSSTFAPTWHVNCLCSVDLVSVLTPEVMAQILANAEVQQRLLPYLPSGESLPQSTEELQNTFTSPQFQQHSFWVVLAMNMFSSALASGQLGPLMNQFRLPAEAVEAANKGDVEAFAKAMEGQGKSKEAGDKKDDEEDMSLD